MNKIQVLIDNGFITDNDVQEYIISNQQDKEEFNDTSSADDDYDDSYPEYVIASTSSLLDETMVFAADEHGEITSWTDLACLAARYGDENWNDHLAAVELLNSKTHKYVHIETIPTGRGVYNWFKKYPINIIKQHIK